MKTPISILLAILVGVSIPIVFIKNSKPLTSEEGVKYCTSQGDPIEEVREHFDHPLQRLLTLKTIISKKSDSTLYVSGYGPFGIKVSEAIYDCGSIHSIKNLIFF